MSDTDAEILELILKAEHDFKREVRRLSSMIVSKSIENELSDYLNGLNDLKADFLCPAINKPSENDISSENLFSDLYNYFQRT